MTNDDLRTLLKASKISSSGLTAVETDTKSRMHEILDSVIKSLDPDRLFDSVRIDYSKDSRLIYEECREKTKGWEAEIGILFLLDEEGACEESLYRFWTGMNSYRENLSGLGCHLIFILFPSSYRSLMNAADHLADWIPLKLHVFSDDEMKDFIYEPEPLYDLAGLKMSPSTARILLSSYEEKLMALGEKGEDVPSSIRRYYLPMFEAAIAIHDLKRAESLRKKISEKDIQPTDLIIWWHCNYSLDYYLRRFDSAYKWALKIHTYAVESANDNLLAANYHNLGVIEQELMHFDEAEKLYEKSLKIKRNMGNESTSAPTYHQLGCIAEKRRKYDEAKKWFGKSLKMAEKQGNEYGVSLNYHHIGMIAHESEGFDKAERWYKKSLEISERHGYEYIRAFSYHNLGIIEQERNNFDKAEKWYIKSLKTKEKQGNEHGAAITLAGLGTLYCGQGLTTKAGEYFIRAYRIFSELNDKHLSELTSINFKKAYEIADQETKTKLASMWKEATGQELIIQDS